MHRTTALLRGVAVLSFALLVAPVMGVGAQVVQGQNQAVAPIALSGPAVAANVTAGGGGPSATGVFAPAGAGQIGNNTSAVVQHTSARSGDANAGSQVLGSSSPSTGGISTPAGSITPPVVITTPATAGIVQGTNAAILPVAVTGAAVTVSATQSGGGPSAVGLFAPAGVLQAGSNTHVAAGVTSAASGSANAGSQVLASARGAAPGGSTYAAWMLIALAGAAVLIAMGRRRPVALAGGGVIDAAEGPDGWSCERTGPSTLTWFDPQSSPDGSAGCAEIGVVRSARHRSGRTLEELAVAASRHTTYRRISAGRVFLHTSDAYRHEFEAELGGVRLRIVEHLIDGPADEIVRIAAYAPAVERRRVAASLNDAVRVLAAA